MASPLYAGHEEPSPLTPALASLYSSNAQQAHDARPESFSAAEARLRQSQSQVQLSSPSLTRRAALPHTASSPALRDTAAACTARAGAEPSLKPSHACRGGAPGGAPSRGAVFASASASTRSWAGEVEVGQAKAKLAKSPPPASWAGEAGWVRGGLGTHGAATSSSQRQRKPHPSPVLLSPVMLRRQEAAGRATGARGGSSADDGGPPQARPSSESRRKPTLKPALAAAPKAKAATPDDAEDLWEDLCRTLREL